MGNVKTNRLLIAAFALFGCVLVFGACLAIASYRWVSDLPNRIVVSIDGKELGRTIVAATEMTLREGPNPSGWRRSRYLPRLAPTPRRSSRL